MRITEIHLYDPESADNFSIQLSPQLNILSAPPELAEILDILLCRKGRPEPQLLKEHTQISAGLILEDRVYNAKAVYGQNRWQLFVTDADGNDATALYRYALDRQAQQDALSHFDGKDPSLPQRLCCYRRREYIEKNQAFHAHLLRYIKDFQPERINCAKKYMIGLDLRGQFRVFHPEYPGEVHLSETEEKLFLYTCFLNLAEFWDRFEAVRNLHHEKKPLVIQNFLEHLDASTDLSRLKERTVRLNQQILVLTK